MKTGRIHLINPATSSFTTNPVFFKRALYSPLAGLLAVASIIPRDRFEVVLTDENIEPVDFDLKADLVGISSMTSYIRRGYEIADAFCKREVKVIMGGVHPSFMPTEALEHADAVVVGEAELVMPKVLEDLTNGRLSGIYKATSLHSLAGLPRDYSDHPRSERFARWLFTHSWREDPPSPRGAAQFHCNTHIFATEVSQLKMVCTHKVLHTRLVASKKN
ncbi:MAG: B12-binding domain-containing radical SAM protein [Syntrophobacteraceae bacterium]